MHQQRGTLFRQSLARCKLYQRLTYNSTLIIWKAVYTATLVCLYHLATRIQYVALFSTHGLGYSHTHMSMIQSHTATLNIHDYVCILLYNF